MESLVLVGDRVLIEPASAERQTRSGLYLPATVAEGDRVGSGRVAAVGPGYLGANPEFSEQEFWAEERSPPRSGYTEPEAHPASTMPYTPMEVTAKM